MNGILPLWKPKGLTSHDCVIKIRKLLKTKKVGHTGTLDPEVEGVLPICIGQATKIVPYLTETKKTYKAEVSLGLATETEDAHGIPIEQKKVPSIDLSQVQSVLSQFLGTIEQVPPMYSAVKVNGKRLYEYAREGKIIDRPKRTVNIFDIRLLSDIKRISATDVRFSFEVDCSKGTYIRTLCVDIGKSLGCPAHMSDLVRTRTASFNKENSFTFDEISSAISNNTIDQIIAPMEKGLSHLDVLYVDESKIKNISFGQKLSTPSQLPSTNPFRVQYEETLLALYKVHPDDEMLLKPVRVFQFDTESR